jgi:hypothetical protein
VLFVRHPAHLWAALSRDAPLAKVAARVELLEAAYVAAARGEAFDQIVVYEDVARDPEKLLAALLKLGYVEQDASAAAATAPACCRRYVSLPRAVACGVTPATTTTTTITTISN